MHRFRMYHTATRRVLALHLDLSQKERLEHCFTWEGITETANDAPSKRTMKQKCDASEGNNEREKYRWGNDKMTTALKVKRNEC